MYTNILLKWTPKHGVNKGKTVTSWFSYGDKIIDILRNEHNAKEIDRV